MNDLRNLEHRPLVIRSHYGDDSIALVQWAFEAGLKQAEVVTIDTGWAATQWQERAKLGEAHAQACGFKTTTILSQIPFAEAVKGRGEFPSPKFQWCSALLKGLPFLDWLDTWDTSCQAVILIAKRKTAAKAHTTLEEWIEKCQFHNDRTVWHPILNIDTLERDALLARAGFTPLKHRTLECDPCVHSTQADLLRLSELDIQKVQALEKIINSPMFEEFSENASTNKQFSNILELIHWAKVNEQQILEDHYLDLFYRGCGNHFGCGL